MTAEQIKRAVDATPFSPFTLHMPNGRSAFVPHRDFISIHPTGRTVIVHNPGRSSSIHDTILVTGLEFKDAEPA